MLWREFYQQNTDSENPAAGIKDWEQRSSYILEWLEKNHIFKDCRILDCASNLGMLGMILKEAGYKNVYGFDLDKRYSILSSESTYSCRMSIDGIGFKSGFFDVIAALNIIEHTKNPDIFLKEVKRLKKPEGLAIFSLPNENLIRNIFGRVENDDHKQSWSYKSFADYLKSKGFDVLKTKPVGKFKSMSFCQTFMILCK